MSRCIRSVASRRTRPSTWTTAAVTRAPCSSPAFLTATTSLRGHRRDGCGRRARPRRRCHQSPTRAAMTTSCSVLPPAPRPRSGGGCAGVPLVPCSSPRSSACTPAAGSSCAAPPGVLLTSSGRRSRWHGPGGARLLAFALRRRRSTRPPPDDGGVGGGDNVRSGGPTVQASLVRLAVVPNRARRCSA